MDIHNVGTVISQSQQSMPFFTKYKPVRLEDSDDLESAAVPPEYSAAPETTPLASDAKIVFIVDEKTIKRRRRCLSFLKWIFITWALIAVVNHISLHYEGEGRRHNGHHRHHKSHGEKSVSSMVDHYVKTGEVKIESSCKSDDGNEVFYYAPEDGVKLIEGGVILLNTTIKNLIADGKINGGLPDTTDHTLKVSLSFESNISPEVFEHLIYSIEYDPSVFGSLTVIANVEEDYEVKGCLIAHLDIHEGADDEDDDDDDDDDDEGDDLARRQRIFAYVGVEGDIGSFELKNVVASNIVADLRTGAVVIEDSSADNAWLDVSTGLIALDGAYSEDFKANIGGAGFVSVKSTSSPSLKATVNTGSIFIVESTIDSLEGKVGAGKITVEEASTTDKTIFDLGVGTGSIKASVDGDHFYGTFDVRSKLGTAKVVDYGTDVPIEVHEPENKWDAHRFVSGTKGAEGEGTGSISISVGVGVASLNFVKLGGGDE
ncbi:hypothetical protein BJ742DRAFT_271298 [Cladochytrium replicatum]|nr:hypothetical protein BJ742DRAFT_271298 [Cladochytrium replicatum]